MAISIMYAKIMLNKPVITVSATNPEQCTPVTGYSHTHGPSCGHETVPHGDQDYSCIIPMATIAMTTDRYSWPK